MREQFEFKQSLSPETEDFESTVEKGVSEAFFLIEKNFDKPEEEKDKMAFHNSEHSRNVIERTEKILLAVQEAEPAFVSNKDMALGKLAAAFHDTVQNWKENKIEDKGGLFKIMRSRFGGQNEKESAALALEFMRHANEESEIGNLLFSESDEKTVREAIETTVATYDAETGTVIQPNLNEKSSHVARAIALADIGAAGMDGPKQYIREGNALFREENMDLPEKLRNPEALSENEKENIKKRIIGWTAGQVKFASGRKMHFLRETRDLPQNARKKIAELFNRFDDSIEAAENKLEERTKMDLKELANDLDY